MALGFGSSRRLERLLLKTRNILNDGEATLFGDENKAQALQMASSYYSLYSGDGSEIVYADGASITILQSEMIATKAAIDLLSSAISYYKEDVVSATGGPAKADFRSDKLDWLRLQLEELKEKLDDLESANGFIDDGEFIPGLLIKKIRACMDPADDVCCGPEDLEAQVVTVGVTP